MCAYFKVKLKLKSDLNKFATFYQSIPVGYCKIFSEINSKKKDIKQVCLEYYSDNPFNRYVKINYLKKTIIKTKKICLYNFETWQAEKNIINNLQSASVEFPELRKLLNFFSLYNIIYSACK